MIQNQTESQIKLFWRLIWLFVACDLIILFSLIPKSGQRV